MDEFDKEELFRIIDNRKTCINVMTIGKEDKHPIVKSLIDYVVDKSNSDHGIIFHPPSKLNNKYEDYPNVEYEISNNYAERCLTFKKSYLVFDDCMHCIKGFSGFEDLCVGSRHYNINPLIITAQYTLSLKPMLRNTFDLIFLCKEDN